jgi:aldehyde dehydrogenase (NAD+)
VGLLHWYAAQAVSLEGKTITNSVPGSSFSYTLREPVGVVGAIIPWNGPIPGAIWKIGPVLATGCTMVLKPAEDTPLSALRLGELCLEAGIPEGVVNVVTGSGEVAGAALAAHPGVDKVAFTGSPETGRAIISASATNIKRLTLELGGKSPNIILEDADLDVAIPGSAMAIFGNSGQVCSAGSRLFVHASIYEEVVEGVAAFGRALRIGDGADPETEMGPLVSQRQMTRVLEYVDLGTQEGAEAVAGGRRVQPPGCERGFFVEPTVFSGAANEMRVAQEEIFGPVVVAIPYDDLDTVARLANDTPYGLGAGIWTRNLNHAHTLARRICAGSVWVNGYQTMDPAVPFGGYKQSGYGKESGTEQLEGYLNTKAVWVQGAGSER